MDTIITEEDMKKLREIVDEIYTKSGWKTYSGDKDWFCLYRRDDEEVFIRIRMTKV